MLYALVAVIKKCKFFSLKKEDEPLMIWAKEVNEKDS